MQSVISVRMMALTVAALLTVAAGLSVSATFRAASPGANLEPVGDAGSIVEIIEGRTHLLWTSLAGTVTSHTTIGWPSTDGDVELGGALTMERPADGTTGVIQLGDEPMTVSFELDR